jgi:hypothetical protein
MSERESFRPLAMPKLNLLLPLGAALLVMVGCATIQRDYQEAPPNITADMPLNDALAAGIRHGGDTMARVKRLVTRRKEWSPATLALKSAVEAGVFKYEDPQLINAMNLYQSAPLAADPALFDKLVTSGRPLARQLGWQMAASMPSREIAAAADKLLSRALIEGEEADHLVPEMAQAVRANRLLQSYTLLRQGLFQTGQEAFATAMAELNPAGASNDFMDYLALAPVDELRQLTLNSVNPMSCIIALKHMLARPVSTAHPSIEHLFYFAVSRNPALAELSMQVIDGYPVTERTALAWTVARLPVWLQIAYVENIRRKTTASSGLFLAELRNITTQPEVVEEIDDAVRR